MLLFKNGKSLPNQAVLSGTPYWSSLWWVQKADSALVSFVWTSGCWLSKVSSFLFTIMDSGSNSEIGQPFYFPKASVLIENRSCKCLRLEGWSAGQCLNFEEQLFIIWGWGAQLAQVTTGSPCSLQHGYAEGHSATPHPSHSPLPRTPSTPDEQDSRPWHHSDCSFQEAVDFPSARESLPAVQGEDFYVYWDGAALLD